MAGSCAAWLTAVWETGLEGMLAVGERSTRSSAAALEGGAESSDSGELELEVDFESESDSELDSGDSLLECVDESYSSRTANPTGRHGGAELTSFSGGIPGAA